MEKNLKEIINITIAGIVCGILLAFPNLSLKLILISLFSIFLHVLFHKIAAKSLKLLSIFELWAKGSIFTALATIFFNVFGFPLKIFLFESLVIAKKRFKLEKRKLTYEQVGLISFAGVAANLLLACIFWLFELPFSREIVEINSLISIFTLIPIDPLDGAKIIYWKRWVWLSILKCCC